MHTPHVTFTSQGRLVEHHGIIAAAEIDNQPVICHFLRETLTGLTPRARLSNSLDLFRQHRDVLARHIAAKVADAGLTNDILHLLPSDLRNVPPAHTAA